MSADSGKTKIFSPQSHCMEQAQRTQRRKTKADHPRSSVAFDGIHFLVKETRS
jgi:hypothetical protein